MYYDAHCHLSTEVTKLPEIEINVEDIKWCNLMSTNMYDANYVFKLGQSNDKVNPCFGIHPWYSHLFTFKEGVTKEEHYNEVLTKSVDDDFIGVLPEPLFVPSFLETLEENLKNSKESAMIGEVGLDKMFKLPWSGFYGNYHLEKTVTEKDGKKLSNHQVTNKHQQDILRACLKLAVKHNRSVSLHCVRAHGALLDIVKEEFEQTDISFALHSYSGSVDHAKAWLKAFPSRVYFSISKIFNMERTEYEDLVRTVPAEYLLLETDYGLDTLYTTQNTSAMHLHHLKSVAQSIATIKNIPDNELIETLYNNWCRFGHFKTD